MNTRYVAEAVVMMLVGIALATLIAWGFEVSSPLTKVWGTVYGLFSYVVWRTIVDTSDTAIEKDEKDDLTPLQAFLAFLLPVVVVIGFVVVLVVGLIALVVFQPQRGRIETRPVDF